MDWSRLEVVSWLPELHGCRRFRSGAPPEPTTGRCWISLARLLPVTRTEGALSLSGPRPKQAWYIRVRGLEEFAPKAGSHSAAIQGEALSEKRIMSPAGHILAA